MGVILGSDIYAPLWSYHHLAASFIKSNFLWYIKIAFTQIFFLFNPLLPWQGTVLHKTSCIFIALYCFLVTPKVTWIKSCSGKPQQGRFQTKATKWEVKRFLQRVFHNCALRDVHTEPLKAEYCTEKMQKHHWEHRVKTSCYHPSNIIISSKPRLKLI